MPGKVVFAPFTEAHSRFTLDATQGNLLMLGSEQAQAHGLPSTGVVLHTSGNDRYRAWKGVTAVVCTDTQGLDVTLGQLGNIDDVLYITGHCSPGSNTLQSDDRQDTIDYEDLADLLENRGLPQVFPGKIKVYACNSQSAPWFRSSFVQKFCDAMYANKYRSCRFFGYTAEVSGIAWNGVNNPGLDSHKWVSGTNRRASEAREEVKVSIAAMIFNS
jgi:hypothetical protein